MFVWVYRNRQVMLCTICWCGWPTSATHQQSIVQKPEMAPSDRSAMDLLIFLAPPSPSACTISFTLLSPKNTKDFGNRSSETRMLGNSSKRFERITHACADFFSSLTDCQNIFEIVQNFPGDLFVDSLALRISYRLVRDETTIQLPC